MARRKEDRKKASQAGGEATKAKHGPSFYQEIGAKGGASRKNGNSYGNSNGSQKGDTQRGNTASSENN